MTDLDGCEDILVSEGFIVADPASARDVVDALPELLDRVLDMLTTFDSLPELDDLSIDEIKQKEECWEFYRYLIVKLNIADEEVIVFIRPENKLQKRKY